MKRLNMKEMQNIQRALGMIQGAAAGLDAEKAETLIAAIEIIEATVGEKEQE